MAEVTGSLGFDPLALQIFFFVSGTFFAKTSFRRGFLSCCGTGQRKISFFNGALVRKILFVGES